MLVAACVGVAAFAPPAAAQADGPVYVDPDSPAGSEYDVPLTRARRDATGAAAGTSGDPSTAPLFGAGITRTQGTGEGASGGGTPNPAAGPGGTAGGGNDAAVPNGKAASDVSLTSSSSSPLVLPGATAVLVLMVGALGAIALRRGRARGDHRQ